MSRRVHNKKRAVIVGKLPVLHLLMLAVILRLAALLQPSSGLNAAGGGLLRGTVSAVRLQWYTLRGTQATQPPALHGRVQKAGPISMMRFHPRLHKPCQADWQKWVNTAAMRGNLTQADLAAQQRPPCTSCQVFVNQRYKIIYLRNAKVASSTVWYYFGGGCGDEAQGCLHVWSHPPMETTPEGAARPAFKPLDQLSEAEVAAVWKDYFVFTVTRDPLSRAVSQYYFLMHSNLAGPPGCREAAEELSWDRFCDSPLVMANFCVRHPACCHNMDTSAVEYKLLHIAPQMPCMTTPDGRLAVDFVLRQDHLDEDLQQLMLHLNSRPGVPKLDLHLPIQSVHKQQRCPSSHSLLAPRHSVGPYELVGTQQMVMFAKEQLCTVDEYFAGQYAHCKAGIASYFADDLRLLYGASNSGRL